MLKPTHPLPVKPPKEAPSFESDYARYQQLLAEMDEVQCLDGKRFLFRQLFSLLDRMEDCIGSPKRVSRPDSQLIYTT
jgi:hypothetical protein